MITFECGCVQEGDDFFYERICGLHAPAWDYWGPPNTMHATAGRIMGRKRPYVPERRRGLPRKAAPEPPPARDNPVSLSQPNWVPPDWWPGRQPIVYATTRDGHHLVPWTPEVMPPEALERAMGHGSWAGWTHHLQQRQLSYAQNGVTRPPTPQEDRVRLQAIIAMANRNSRIEQSRRDREAAQRRRPTASQVRAKAPIVITGAWPGWPGGPPVEVPRPKPRPRRSTGTKKGRAWVKVQKLMAAGMDCRICGTRHRHINIEPETGLVLGHIRAHSLGGGNGLSNRAIVCRACDKKMGSSDWTGRIVSISAEIGTGSIVLPKS